MNKKALAALVGTLAFGTATVTAYAGDAPAKEEKPAKAEKGKKDGAGDATKPKDDKKKGKDGSCGGAGGCGGKKEGEKKPDAPK
jgi:hypothetical protein